MSGTSPYIHGETAIAAVPTPDAGLGVDAARIRLLADGPNLLLGAEGVGILGTVWEVVREPMFLLLLAAGSLYLFMGETADALMLLGFVAVVMGITVVQEQRTGRAIAALKQLSSPKALVIRSGIRQRLPARDLVRGDLIVISEGDRIPADAILRSSDGLEIDESLLTGESIPVTKLGDPHLRVMDDPGGDGLCSVFSGTLAVTGQGIAEVTATGARSELGRIGHLLRQMKPERSRLQVETGHMVGNLAIVGAVLCIIVVVVYAITRGSDPTSWRQGLLAGITMAMAVLPEEFPIILTIFLALGAWRISRSRVLTRRMPAIETLGATTVLCTDKTGTLTLNRMAVTQISLRGQMIDIIRSAEVKNEEVRLLLETALLASRANPFDPMEAAIQACAESSSPGALARRNAWNLVRQYPIAPDLLAVSQVWRSADGVSLMAASKGAPEAIFGLCGLPPERIEVLASEAAALAGRGLRVLGVAKTMLDANRIPARHQDLDLDFVGLIGLEDPLRPGVPAAVAECRSAGIRVMMITGDYPATAQAIARAAGISSDHQVVTGADISRLTDAELAVKVHTVQVFARVTPQQKLRIVMALKANRDVVAMTGDGVNDAPALKAAHIGIAMGGRGSDVARESAGLVLLDDDFGSIVSAIRMGRRIFDNITKAISFTFAVHVPIAGLSILPVFIPGWPLLLLPVHIVFLELVIDPSCTLIYESEPEESDVMTRPPRLATERLYSWRNIAASIGQGLCALAACIAIFVCYRPSHGDDASRAMAFVTLVSASIAIIIANRSWSRGLFHVLATPNRAQLLVILGTMTLMTMILAMPAARNMFHFAPLHTWDIIVCIGVGIVCLGWFEVAKRLRRNGIAPAATAQSAAATGAIPQANH